MTVELFPLTVAKSVRHNTQDAELVELAIAQDGAQLSASGAVCVETGVHTGRSVLDKYTVRDGLTEKAVWWDNNRAMDPEQFDLLAADFRDFASGFARSAVDE